jgi:phospholipid/cholesterol/gamma-HCH transport system substrate-binding protein
MISERPRNFIVGLTFLLALAVSMYGIILLGKFPSVSIGQYPITLTAPNANGVTSGSKVLLNGVPVGLVESAWLSPDAQGRLVVFIRANIDSTINIPASATASAQAPSTVGQPYLALFAADAKAPFLAHDGKATLVATAPESSLIPQSVVDDIHALKVNFASAAQDLSTTAQTLTLTAQNVTKVANDLHVLLDYAPPEAIANANPNDPNRPRENISTVVVRLDRTVEGLQNLLTDPKLHGQVRDVVQNISDAAGQLKSTLAKFDKTLDNANGAIASIGNAATSFSGTATQATVAIQGVQKDVNRVAQQLVETVAQLDKSIRQITEGKGTAGMLVNDPRLYDGLIDLSKSLKNTVNDLDFLINKWKDEGVNLNLK